MDNRIIPQPVNHRHRDLGPVVMCRRCGAPVRQKTCRTRDTYYELIQSRTDEAVHTLVLHTVPRCRRRRRNLEMLSRGHNRWLDIPASDAEQADAIVLLRQLDPVEIDWPDWWRGYERARLTVLRGGRS